MKYTTEQIEGHIAESQAIFAHPEWRNSREDHAAAMLRQLLTQRAELLEALKDMRNGWRYIRETHGDLYGVGWDRAENKANAAITNTEATK